MAPATHLLLSWIPATLLPTDRRGRLAITLTGIVPDLDGFGAPFEMLSGGSLPWFTDYHHRLLHNGLTGLVLAGVAWAWCRRDWRVGLAVLGTFHLHLLCDLVGSRGPDGHDWPIPYLLPFHGHELRWAGQWPLSSWQNLVISVAAIAVTVWLARRQGRSPVELLNLRLDQRVVAALRRSGRQP
jgi:hypothetical protein